MKSLKPASTSSTDETTTTIDVPSYYAGYYAAAEEILNWLRGAGNHMMMRKALERKLVDMQPRRLKADD